MKHEAALADRMAAQDAKNYGEAYLESRMEILHAASSFIRRMSLEVLSRGASFLYSEDDRSGSGRHFRALEAAS
jgi:hypothetical protein